MKNFHRVCRRAIRFAAVPAAALGILMNAAATHAAPLGSGDLDKARAAATSPAASALLQHSLSVQSAQEGRADRTQDVAPTGAASVASGQAAVVDPTGIPVYALNPAFVKGTSREASVLWYVAFGATQGTAHNTLFTAPDESGGWKPVNVASGDTEKRMSTLAKGSRLLFEPQIGAWYALSDHQVRALNHSAMESIGKTPITLTNYQQKVAAKYRDKLPGSPYDHSGTAGGFNSSGTTEIKATETDPITQTAGPTTPLASPIVQRLVALGGVAVLGAVALSWLMLRRRAS